MPRRIVIRLGPDVVDRRRERRIGRVLNNRDGDRFTPTAECANRAAPVERCATGDQDSLSAKGVLLDQAVSRAARDLAVAEDRLAVVKAELVGLAAAAAALKFDQPVAYAYGWNPPAPTAPAPEPRVIHVPGVVQTFVAPTGRLIDVLR